jgi:hypothetical protein
VTIRGSLPRFSSGVNGDFGQHPQLAGDAFPAHFNILWVQLNPDGVTAILAATWPGWFFMTNNLAGYSENVSGKEITVPYGCKDLILAGCAHIGVWGGRLILVQPRYPKRG